MAQKARAAGLAPKAAPKDSMARGNGSARRTSPQAPTGSESDDLLGSPVDTAMSFLAKHYAALPGFANVVAIDPDTGELHAAGAPTNDTGKLRPFVEAHRDACNLYFSVNPTKAKLRKKASKRDIQCAAYLHCDIDPRAGQPLASEKKRILGAAKSLEDAPTSLVDTGGGVALFYRLREPMADLEAAETLNRQLAQQLGGDNCHNIDRVMRLPGTTNFPDERKRRKGRTECEARLLWQKDTTYRASDFDYLPAVPDNASVQTGPLDDVEVPQRFYDDVLALDTDIRHRWDGSTDGLMDASRSGMDMSLVSLLVRGWDFTDSEIAAILRAFAHGKAAVRGDEYIRAMLAKARAAADTTSASAWIAPTPIAEDEWATARSAPDCIVDRYYYADVGVFVAPGGVGKTTLMLYKAVHVALGLPLFGHEIRRPGPVVVVTHEDSRELLVARLRSIVQAMELDGADRQAVMRRVLIADVSGTAFRLTAVLGDVVVPSASVEDVIASCRELKPALLVIDPAVSFGVGESRVNDAEQGLIEAGRKLRRALNCCVLYIHHTGKQNAREKTVDQYSGRGGSAFADGARMVHVLQTISADDWQKETGETLSAGQSGMRLVRAKMSYCASMPQLLIKRDGYAFSVVARIAQDPEAERREDAKAILNFLLAELKADRRYTANKLEEEKPCGLSRDDIRKAVTFLRDRRWVEVRSIPPEARTGRAGHGAHKYLHPIYVDTSAPPDCDGGAEAEMVEEDVLS